MGRGRRRRRRRPSAGVRGDPRVPRVPSTSGGASATRRRRRATRWRQVPGLSSRWWRSNVRTTLMKKPGSRRGCKPCEGEIRLRRKTRGPGASAPGRARGFESKSKRRIVRAADRSICRSRRPGSPGWLWINSPAGPIPVLNPPFLSVWLKSASFWRRASV